jgi:uncharacterized protein YcsI (UPF0317 family)
VSDVGNPHIPALGLDLDIRTDLPGYRVWQDGELVEETADVTKWWREDLVSFVIGCSYSFEPAVDRPGPVRPDRVESRRRRPLQSLRRSLRRRVPGACPEPGAGAGKW